MQNKIIVVCAVIFTMFMGLNTAAGQETKEDSAVKAAEQWLALVDNADYAASWDNAAAYFKDNVSQEQWEDAVKAVRAPMGKVMERNLLAKQYLNTLPNAPTGEYVVIQFSASFKNKPDAIETVTPMLDKDGQWRVSGYYIK